MKDFERPHLFGVLAGLFLAVALVCSAMFATTAWLKIKNTQFITVKGSARKNIKSDLAIWRGAFTVEAATLVEAQRRLKTDRSKVEKFLGASQSTNFVFSPIGIEELRSTATLSNASGTFTHPTTTGFRLTQAVRVDSEDVDRTVELDRDSSLLVESGVLFTTAPLEFIYTKAGEAKIEMLAEATKDARTRAEQMAGQGGRDIAHLHTADMGVIQIAPLYSGQTSWEGMNDTTSLEKTITAVVTASFALK